MKKVFKSSVLLLAIIVTSVFGSCSKDDDGVGPNNDNGNDNTDNPISTTWEKVNLNTTENLNKIQFVSNTVGFIVGNKGKLFKTTDGGKKWVSVNSGVTHNLISLSFNGSGKGMINGLKTVDNGATWSKQESTNEYYSYYVSGDVLVGGSSSDFNANVKRSTDNGAAWANVHSVAPKTGFYTDGMFSGNTGYLTSWYSGRILKTTNGGTSWTVIAESDDQPTGETGIYDDFYSVFTKNQDIVYASTNRFIIKSTNGGSAFSVLYKRELNSHAINGVFVENNNIIAVDYGGNVLISTDDGQNWIKEAIIPSKNLNDSVITQGNVFVVGNNGEFWRKKL